MSKQPIVISSTDKYELQALLDSARLDRRIPLDSLTVLERELTRAEVVPASDVPPDVVTMNANVTFVDLTTGEEDSYTLVYPRDANMLHDRISVLAPIGMALLGYRVGDVIEWAVPAGKRRLRITKVDAESQVMATSD